METKIKEICPNCKQEQEITKEIKKITCPNCKGDGKEESYGPLICHQCNGTGEINYQTPYRTTDLEIWVDTKGNWGVNFPYDPTKTTPRYELFGKRTIRINIEAGSTE